MPTSNLTAGMRRSQAILDDAAARSAIEARRANAPLPYGTAMAEQLTLVEKMVRDQQWIARGIAAADAVRHHAEDVRIAVEAARVAQSDPVTAMTIAGIEGVLKDETRSLRTTTESAAAARKIAVESIPVDLTAAASNALQAFQTQAEIAHEALKARLADQELRIYAATLNTAEWQGLIEDAIELSGQAQQALDALGASTRIHANEAIGVLELATRRALRDRGSISELPERKQLDTAIAGSLASIRKEIDELPEEQARAASRSIQILEEVLVEPAMVEAWLTSPHADLGYRTPLQVIREGHAEAVRGMLEGALEGLPS